MERTFSNFLINTKIDTLRFCQMNVAESEARFHQLNYEKIKLGQRYNHVKEFYFFFIFY